MKHYNAQSNDYNNLKKFMSKKITPSRVKPTLQVSRAILVALAMVGLGLLTISKAKGQQTFTDGIKVEDNDDAVIYVKRTNRRDNAMIYYQNNADNGTYDQWRVGIDGSGNFGFSNDGVFGDKLIIKSDGKMGIGTAAPLHALHVNGVAYINNNLVVKNNNTSDWNVLYGSTTLFNPSDYSLFVRGGSVGAGSGGVSDFAGIKFGTNGHDESQPLQVDDAGSIILEEQDATNNYGDFVFLLRNTTSTDNDIHSSTDEKMRITSVGKVGIGTSSPSQMLDVNGTGKFTDLYWGESRLTSDQGGSIELGAYGTNTGSGNPYIDFHFNNGVMEDYNARIINSEDKKLEIQLGIDSQGLLDVHGSAQFSGTVKANALEVTTTTNISETSSPSLIINKTRSDIEYGEVKINVGPSSDQKQWALQGTQGSFRLNYNDANGNYLITDLLTITNGGKVGIGESSPTAFLEIVGQLDNGQVNNNVLHLKSYTPGGNRDMLTINTFGLHPYLEIYDYDNEGNKATDIKFNTQGDSWFNGGKVGIGTDVPIAELDVRGNVNIAAGATSPSISSSNLSNFLLWVEKGIVSEELAISDKTDWADYVFEESYELTSLEELNAYVNREKHLPGIPGVEEIQKKNYYMVHEMLKGQLKNLEEQVLHNIRQEKRILEQEEVIQSLLERIEKLEVDRDQ